MTDDLHPTEGARFLFAHLESDDAAASYDAAIFTPDARFDYAARLEATGTVDLSAVGDAAPADLERKLTTIARVMARDADKNRTSGLPPWPHRVLRWRGPK